MQSSKNFIESTDYVNVNSNPRFSETAGPSSIGPIRGNAGSSGNSARYTQYSRPMTSVKTKMPAQNFFLPTSSLFRDEDSDSASVSNPPNLEANWKAIHVQQHWKNPVADVSISTKEPSVFNAVGKSPKNLKRKFIKPSPQNLKRIMIGSVEHVIRWNKTAREANLTYMFEAVGTLDSWTAKGSVQLIFLRGDLGQIIQGLFYSIDYTLPSLVPGSNYSMIGKMVGSHKMIVMDVNEIPDKEKSAIQRLAFLCQRALNLAAGISPTMNT